jgi:hypothetical protein
MKILLAVLFALFISVPRLSLACTCTEQTVSEAFAEAEAVFMGKVASIKYLDDRSGWIREPRVVVTFNVFAYWKGDVGRKIILHTYQEYSSCNGFNFEQGKEYIVYATKSPGNRWLNGGEVAPASNAILSQSASGRPRPVLKGEGLPAMESDILGTHTCTRTTELNEKLKDSDFKFLGAPKPFAKK